MTPLSRAAGEGAAALEDRWIRSRLNQLALDVNRLAGDFQLGQAADRIYEFVWHEYADWYIEMAKIRIARGDRSPVPVLIDVLTTSLRLLHPYMPYVTEEIWQNLRPYLGDDLNDALIVAPYPAGDEAARDLEAERLVSGLIEIVRAARNLKAERRLPAGGFAEAVLVVPDAATRAALGERVEVLEALARLRPLTVVAAPADAPREGVATAVLADATVVLPLAGVDTAAERDRLNKEIAEAEGYAARMEGQLANETFRARAPEKVVRDMEEKLAAARTRLVGLRRSLAELG
jgi:valyl-tRNA synthetase